MKAIKPYSETIEAKMVLYYQTLSEKERRRYAAIEAEKIGYGGISYMVRLLGCRPETIKRGMEEMKSPEIIKENRIRKKGAGRKKCLEIIEGIDQAFLSVIDQHIAGSPMDQSIRWTNLTRQQIANLLDEEQQIKVSVTVIDQLLEKHNFRRRKAVKSKATGSNSHRNEQFEKINFLVESYQKEENPVISMDTKKKKN
jgi:hypothetical protein